MVARDGAKSPLILALCEPDRRSCRNREGGAARRGHRHRPPDYPNQVNNVPASRSSSAGARRRPTTITEAMELAAVRASPDLRWPEQSDVVRRVPNLENMRSGPEYLIPKPFDPAPDQCDRAGGREGRWSRRRHAPDRRLRRVPERLTTVRLPLGPPDEADLRRRPSSPAPDRHAEGEDERVLRAAQVVVDEGPRAADPGRAADGRRSGASKRFGLPGSGRARDFDDQPESRTSATATTGTSTYRLTAAQKASGGLREDRDAPPAHADRRDDDPSRRRRRHDLRHLRDARAAPAIRRPGDRLRRGIARITTRR